MAIVQVFNWSTLTVRNWKILPEQRFTAHTQFQSATSAVGLSRTVMLDISTTVLSTPPARLTLSLDK